MSHATSDREEHRTAASAALIERFAVVEPAERMRLLRRLLDDHVPVTLHLPGDAGEARAARLVELDEATDRIELRLADEGAPAAPTRATAPLDAVHGAHAQATLDGVALRFELGAAQLAGEGRIAVLRAPLPRRLARLQRRDAFRVAPPETDAPRLFVPLRRRPHEARILDLSATGVALEWPSATDVPAVGETLRGCRLELPSTPAIHCALSVRSVAPSEGAPTRLGCAFVGIDPAAERSIQVFVNLAQTLARRLRPSLD
jgi:c-di-GMP-binding flagellar brake protein YcgR